MADDLALALELADLADEITLERFRAADLVVDRKPDMTPVTEADRSVEEGLRARLSAARPADGVLGEEFGESGDAPRRWIIDPIDGTKSYVRGMPSWGTLLALQSGDQLELGVVSAPALGRRWWALRGQGAWVTDGLPGSPRRIGVSAVRELGAAQLSFGGLDEWTEAGRVDALISLGRECWRTRGFGDFWSYMLVAEGAADIALDPIVALWDLAAPMIIVEEAGGLFTDFAGVARADGGSAVATNGPIHDSVLEILSSG